MTKEQVINGVVLQLNERITEERINRKPVTFSEMESAHWDWDLTGEETQQDIDVIADVEMGEIYAGFAERAHYAGTVQY